MLKKWFPKMEKFEGQLRKYQKSIDLLEKENAELPKKQRREMKTKSKHSLRLANCKAKSWNYTVS